MAILWGNELILPGTRLFGLLHMASNALAKREDRFALGRSTVRTIFLGGLPRAAEEGRSEFAGSSSSSSIRLIIPRFLFSDSLGAMFGAFVAADCSHFISDSGFRSSVWLGSGREDIIVKTLAPRLSSSVSSGSRFTKGTISVSLAFVAGVTSVDLLIEVDIGLHRFEGVIENRGDDFTAGPRPDARAKRDFELSAFLLEDDDACMVGAVAFPEILGAVVGSGDDKFPGAVSSSENSYVRSNMLWSCLSEARGRFEL